MQIVRFWRGDPVIVDDIGYYRLAGRHAASRHRDPAARPPAAPPPWARPTPGCWPGVSLAPRRHPRPFGRAPHGRRQHRLLPPVQRHGHRPRPVPWPRNPPAGHPDLVPNERPHAHPAGSCPGWHEGHEARKARKRPGRLLAVSGPAALTSPHQALFRPRVPMSQLSVVDCVSPSVALVSSLI
jgi:hypothetical protein